MSIDPLNRAVTSQGKLHAAVAKHLDIDLARLEDAVYRKPDFGSEVQVLSAHYLTPDSVFGPRVLYIVRLLNRVHVLRVMTSPLQQEFSVHEEAVL